ncbi:hypothetical protein AQ611_06160 [Burkholderia singularis]|nr:hypothetical protein AQ611_06160 [Burkholderia sp. Bp7605]
MTRIQTSRPAYCEHAGRTDYKRDVGGVPNHAQFFTLYRNSIRFSYGREPLRRSSTSAARAGKAVNKLTRRRTRQAADNFDEQCWNEFELEWRDGLDAPSPSDGAGGNPNQQEQGQEQRRPLKLLSIFRNADDAPEKSSSSTALLQDIGALDDRSFTDACRDVLLNHGAHACLNLVRLRGLLKGTDHAPTLECLWSLCKELTPHASSAYFLMPLLFKAMDAPRTPTQHERAVCVTLLNLPQGVIRPLE